MRIQDKQRAMQQLQQQLLRDTRTHALRVTSTQLVMGAGNLNATIVFIGEAPGKREDEQGVPFVGASGKLLNEMLASVGLHRDDIYITNIVKYRPPNNRDPTKAEKQAFLPYLLQQLSIIQPKTVVTLGRHSMEYFLPGAVIGDVHGQVHTVVIDGKAWRVVPLYHPAAALYNGSLRHTLLNDFARILQ